MTELTNLINTFEVKSIIEQKGDMFNGASIVMATVGFDISTVSDNDPEKINDELSKILPDARLHIFITKKSVNEYGKPPYTGNDRKNTFGPSITIDDKNGYNIKLFKPRRVNGVMICKIIVPGIRKVADLGSKNTTIIYLLEILSRVTGSEWSILKSESYLANYTVLYNDPNVRMNNLVAIDYFKHIPGLLVYTKQQTVTIKIQKKTQLKRYKYLKHALSIQITGKFKIMIKLSGDLNCLVHNSIILLNMLFINKNVLYRPLIFQIDNRKESEMVSEQKIEKL